MDRGMRGFYKVCGLVLVNSYYSSFEPLFEATSSFLEYQWPLYENEGLHLALVVFSKRVVLIRY